MSRWIRPATWLVVFLFSQQSHWCAAQDVQTCIVNYGKVSGMGELRALVKRQSEVDITSNLPGASADEKSAHVEAMLTELNSYELLIVDAVARGKKQPVFLHERWPHVIAVSSLGEVPEGRLSPLRVDVRLIRPIVAGNRLEGDEIRETLVGHRRGHHHSRHRRQANGAAAGRTERLSLITRGA